MDWKEIAKRLGALGFAAVYVHTHHVPRAGALRVASHALRFLNGENVDTINEEADHADTVRESKAKESGHPEPQSVTILKRLIKKARKSHG